METTKNRKKIGTHAWSMLIVLISATMAMAGATRQFTFDNSTGQAVNDLHIEFKQAVEPVAGATGDYGPFPNVQGSGTSKVDFDGGTVANAASATIKFKTTSSKITIKRWWWTKDGRRIGHIRTRLASQTLPLDAHFHQLDWLADDLTPLYPDSVVGEMALEFDGSEAALLADKGGAYVNVVIDSAMPSPTSQPQWVVRNLYLAYPDPEYMANASPTVQFRLPGQNGEDITEIWAGLVVSDQPATQFPLVPVEQVPVWDRSYLTGGFSGGSTALSDLPNIIGPWVGALLGNLPVAWAWTWQGADEIPAVDEDDNGCAPASAARSVAYLGAAHGFATGDVQDIYDDLYDNMDTDATGTSDDDMLSGKDKYAGDSGLPIESELVYGMEHLDDVMDAINDGADVEILISWDPNGGHAAMITSITKFADGSYEITYVDDPTQGDDEAENEEHTIHVKPDGSFQGGRVDGFMIERVPTPVLFDIGPGFDLWHTPPCGASIDLPGIGLVPLEGLPMGPGSTDTIIQRFSGLDFGETGQTQVELVELSLVSCEPITVDMGNGPSQWDVFVSLDPGASSPGTLTIQKHDDAEHSNGGTFDASFKVNAIATLHPRGGGQEQFMHVSDTLNIRGASWSHDSPANYPHPEHAGRFFPVSIAQEDPHRIMSPAMAQGVAVPNGDLPVLCDPGNFNTGYHLVDQAHARWEDDVQQMIVELTPPSIHCPTEILDRTWDVDPLTGRFVEVENFKSILDGQIKVTNRLTGQVMAEGLPLQLTGDVQALVFDRDPNQIFGAFETELAWMQLQGSIPLPGGNLFVAISVGREHPGGRSLGHTEVLPVGNIGSSGQDGIMVASYFDVFTYLWVWNTLAQDWAGPFPSQGPPAHMVLGPPHGPGDGGVNPGGPGGIGLQ